MKGTDSFTVRLEVPKCSLCEMCALRCPTGAIRTEIRGSIEDLVFESSLCDGCGGDPFCEVHCPEKCIELVRSVGSADIAAPVVLISGELAGCYGCKALFVPEKKIEVLLGKSTVQPKDIQKFCPVCRRKLLLDNYPGS